MVKKGLTIVVQPSEFFRFLLLKAMQEQNLKILEITEYYLVNLLTRFVQSDSLFSENQDGTKTIETCVAMLQQVMQHNGEEKMKILRQMADTSLYMAGFFSDYFSKKIIDIDYYISMGRKAYGDLAVMNKDGEIAVAYAELENRFKPLVDILAAVKDETSATDDKSLLELYDRWLSTGNKSAEKKLRQEGIVLDGDIKKKIQ